MGQEYMDELVNINVQIEKIKRDIKLYMELTKNVPGDTLYARLIYLVNLYDISQEEAGR